MDYDVYARTGGEKSLQSRDSRTGRENLGRAGVSITGEDMQKERTSG